MRTKKAIISIAILALAGCAKNLGPNVDPRVPTALAVKEAVIAIHAVQSVAIELNNQGLVPDKDTKLVIDSVKSILLTIQTAPAGWKATVLHALDELELKLDASAKQKLAPYILLAKVIFGRLEA